MDKKHVATVFQAQHESDLVVEKLVWLVFLPSKMIVKWSIGLINHSFGWLILRIWVKNSKIKIIGVPGRCIVCICIYIYWINMYIYVFKPVNKNQIQQWVLSKWQQGCSVCRRCLSSDYHRVLVTVQFKHHPTRMANLKYSAQNPFIGLVGWMCIYIYTQLYVYTWYIH